MPAYKRLLLTIAAAVLVVVAFSSTADAQYRRGRVSRVVVVGGYYYDPFFYDPWYAYPSQWGWYPPYRGRYLDAEANVRLEVKPKEAEVYVDGYYAGIVDDFDGAFQRLHVEPGEHEIELYLDGYRTVKQKVYLTADNTFKVKYTMEKLGAGEQAEARPQPPNPPPGAQQMPPRDYPPSGYPPSGYPPSGYPPQQPPSRGPAARRMPPPQQPQGPPERRADQNAAYGSIAVRVQPNDAEVSIDGEPWRAPGGQERLVVEVSEGSHTVEIRKQGYRTYVTQIDVRRGETTPLNVSLRSEP